MKFQSISDISTKKQSARGIKLLSGYSSVGEILDIPDTRNIRVSYIDVVGITRTSVHKTIRKSLAESPADFGLMNGGISIICSKATVNGSVVTFSADASIINGSQTRGECKALLQDYLGKTDAESIKAAKAIRETEIKIDIICLGGDSEVLGHRISVARNYTNRVKDITIQGAMGVFDDVEKVFAGIGVVIRKSESDSVGINTGRILRCAMGLVPDHFYRAAKFPVPTALSLHTQNRRFVEGFGALRTEVMAGEASRPKINLYRAILDMLIPAYSIYSGIAENTNDYFPTAPSGKKAGNFLTRTVTEADIAKKRPGSGKVIRCDDGIAVPVLYSLKSFFVFSGNRLKLGISQDALNIVIRKILDASMKTCIREYAGNAAFYSREKSSHALLAGLGTAASDLAAAKGQMLHGDKFDARRVVYGKES